jgi:hypothetical protein
VLSYIKHQQFLFLFLLLLFFPYDNRHVSCSKRGKQFKECHAYWNWHFIFWNAPHIAKDWFRNIMCPPKSFQQSFLTKCHTWHCNIHSLTPYYSPKWMIFVQQLRIIKHRQNCF